MSRRRKHKGSRQQQQQGRQQGQGRGVTVTEVMDTEAMQAWARAMRRLDDKQMTTTTGEA